MIARIVSVWLENAKHETRLLRFALATQAMATQALHLLEHSHQYKLMKSVSK